MPLCCRGVDHEEGRQEGRATSYPRLVVRLGLVSSAFPPPRVRVPHSLAMHLKYFKLSSDPLEVCCALFSLAWVAILFPPLSNQLQDAPILYRMFANNQMQVLLVYVIVALGHIAGVFGFLRWKTRRFLQGASLALQIFIAALAMQVSVTPPLFLLYFIIAFMHGWAFVQLRERF